LDNLTAQERKVYFDLHEDGQIQFARQYRGLGDTGGVQDGVANALTHTAASSAQSAMKEFGRNGFYVLLVMSFAAGIAMAMGKPIFWLFMPLASLNGLFILMWIAGIIEVRLIEIKQALEAKEASAL